MLIHVDSAGKPEHQILRNYGVAFEKSPMKPEGDRGFHGVLVHVSTWGVAKMCSCTQKALLGSVRHVGQLVRQRQQHVEFT